MSGQVICAPLRVEARALRRGLRGAATSTSSASAARPGITVLRTGYGPVRSAEAASRLARMAPDMIAVGGVAGALAGDLRRGDLVFWRGHVAIVRDHATLLHANAFHMAVAIEPIAEALTRICGAGSEITSVRRLAR